VTTTTEKVTARVESTADLQWWPIAEMRFSSLAQRGLKPARVDYLVANFDLDQLGYPVVNRRADGSLYVIDGQHRIEALRQLGLGDQLIECVTFTGLTEEEEAKRFLRRNDVLPVGAFPKFMIGVTAGEPEPVQIKYIVERAGLQVSLDNQPGSIHAVGALRRAFRRSPESLDRGLRLIMNAYGDAGLLASTIDGFSLFLDRFNDMVDDTALAERLGSARGSVGGLLGRADALRRSTHAALNSCMAAAVVEIWNTGPPASRNGQPKLPNWWKAIAE
jgi:Family of unknown function (DUF6551)